MSMDLSGTFNIVDKNFREVLTPFVSERSRRVTDNQ
jgi:hypothetical protein